MEVIIDRYESVMRIGSIREFGKTQLSAFGTIDGERYTYVRMVEFEEAEPSQVPHWFVQEADAAFNRRAGLKETIRRDCG